MEGKICRCQGCKAPLKIKEGQHIVDCEYCGNTNILPKMLDEDAQRRYETANDYLDAGEYDRAEKMFESLLGDYSSDAELYWSLLMCKYGVHYEQDPSDGKAHPTIQKMQDIPILSNKDYSMALQFASDEERPIYEQKAKEISNIQKRYSKIVSSERPFDIFISYKESETDEFGNSKGRTKDSVLAEEIYESLTHKGYKVFFSRITLEDKIGEEYEPYIFAALNSAKVMLLVTMSEEHTNATWVKNEWKRFQQLRAEDRNKRLIVVYKDMDPKDLPEDLQGIQAQDMNKIGAEQDLLRGISKIISHEEKDKNSTLIVEVENYVKIAGDSLEFGDFEKAKEAINAGLYRDAENAQLYLYRLLLHYRARNLQDLKRKVNSSMDDEVDYKVYLKYENDQERLKLVKEINERINKRIQRDQEEKEKQDKIAAENYRKEAERREKEQQEYRKKDEIYQKVKKKRFLVTRLFAIPKLRKIKDYPEARELLSSYHKANAKSIIFHICLVALILWMMSIGTMSNVLISVVIILYIAYLTTIQDGILKNSFVRPVFITALTIGGFFAAQYVVDMIVLSREDSESLVYGWIIFLVVISVVVGIVVTISSNLIAGIVVGVIAFIVLLSLISMLENSMLAGKVIPVVYPIARWIYEMFWG